MRFRSARHLATILSSLGLLAAAAGAQSETTRAGANSSAASPEAAAAAYAGALKAGDWAAAARAMHPDALRQVRQLVTTLAARDSSHFALRRLMGVDSPAALEALPDTVIYARFLRSVFGAATDVAAAMRGATTTVLGHVPEGPELAHVVLRIEVTVRSVRLTRVEVVSMRRDRGAWRALLSQEMEGLVAAALSSGA